MGDVVGVADEAKGGVLLGGLDIGLPASAIKGSAASALSSTSPFNPAEAYQFFRIIDEQADHMRSLINDLLDVTRIEAGALSITPETSSVASLVDQARAAFLGGGAANSVEVDLPPDLPPVAADRQRVVQVLTNLFSNASKYSPASSTIMVTASQQDSHVAVSVADEGRGVSSEEPPQLPQLAVRDGLADLVKPERLIESRFGPVLGTHLGPNTIGVAATQASVEDD